MAATSVTTGVARAHLALPARRALLLIRIHAAREETAIAARWVAQDLGAIERSRRSIMTGLAIARTTLIAAGVIWSFNAASRVGRGRRLLTVAIRVLSTLRALRKFSTLLGALARPVQSAPSPPSAPFTSFTQTTPAKQFPGSHRTS